MKRVIRYIVKCSGARLILAPLLLFYFTLYNVQAQSSIDALRLERERAEKEIELLDSQLAKLTNSKEDLSKELALLMQRIKKSRSVLTSIDSQLKILDNRESKQSSAALLLSEQLEQMQALLKRDVRELYLMKLSLEDGGLFLTDSLRSRYAYIRTISDVLISTIISRTDEIESIKGDLGQELREIATRRVDLAKLRGDQQVALTEIDAQRVRIEQLSKALNTSEISLVKQREEKSADLRDLQSKIEELIRAEMLKNGASGDESLAANELTQEQLDSYSSSFVSQGSSMLPPIVGATITARFGLNTDSEQAGVKLQNNGVNLSAPPSSKVMVVADGQVKKIFVIGTLGVSVLVRHGKYLTVYSNLGSTSVAQGQQVVKGEALGNLGGDGTLHFEVWNETTVQDPEKWIKF